MKIFQIITLSELGGAQSVLVNLSNALATDKHEVIVIAGDGGGKMFQLLDERIRHIQLKYLKRKISIFSDFLSVISLFRLYMQYKPDVIHLHSSKIGILGRMVFPKYKIIYTVHGFDSIRVAYRKFLPIERKLQKRCRAIVGVSKYDQQNMLSEGIHNNVQCIYNGVSKIVVADDVRLDLFSKYQKTILCVARVSKPKRFDLFIKIAERLPNYAFVWIGNQEPIENLPANVFCLGNIPNAGAYNHLVDMFILPTDYEGLPMVILEAMSFGKPIVASNVGGISEIVIDNENGYVVENTADAFVEKIKYILEDNDVIEKFSNNSLNYFNEKLTVQKMFEGYMGIYNTIVDSNINN